MKLSLTLTVIPLLLFIAGFSILADDDGIPISETLVYPDHLPGAYTGGFGEKSCHSCHFDYDLNPKEGSLKINTASSYKKGERLSIEITVLREDMGKAGFQMTARFKDGKQAGRFELNENFAETPIKDSKVQYLQHGIGEITAKEGFKTWFISWIAPENNTDSVYLNIAVNAANGDNSEFGDWIYVDEIILTSLDF